MAEFTFDKTNKDDVKKLQEKLNRLTKALGKEEQLPVDGNWDHTKQAWLDFKKNLWVDEKLAPGYLHRDETGLKFSKANMEQMGFTFETKESTKDSKKIKIEVITFGGKPYDPSNPPSKVIAEVQKRLKEKGMLEGVYTPGKMDDATKAAIIKQ